MPSTGDLGTSSHALLLGRRSNEQVYLNVSPECQLSRLISHAAGSCQGVAGVSGLVIERKKIHLRAPRHHESKLGSSVLD